MRLGGRLQAAIEVLNEIGAGNRPAADILRDWGTSHRFAGAGDRAAIGNIVYDALRRRLSLAWRMDDETAAALAYAALLSDGNMNADDIAQALEGDRFAPSPLNAQQLKSWQERDLNNAPAHIQADVAPWYVPALEATFGDEWIREAAALASRPPVDLRVNRLRATPQQVIERLAAVGADKAPYLDDAVRIPPIEAMGRHPNLQADEAFKDGWFEIQDLGSQLAACFADVKPGEQVLDYCAGAGGKTLALAAKMNNRGQIHAYDAEKARLTPIFERLKRAGVRNTQAHESLTSLEPLKEKMDVVLTDAPCTGSGTWRRRPDAKWRLTSQQLERRMEDQRLVLDHAKAFVKPGGRLVYVTCSLFDGENHKQISRFLADNPDYIESSPETIWQSITQKSGEQAHMSNSAFPGPVYPQHGAIFSPRRTDTDGFYVAVLNRRMN